MCLAKMVQAVCPGSGSRLFRGYTAQVYDSPCLVTHVLLVAHGMVLTSAGAAHC